MPNQYGIVEKIARVCEHCGETFYRYPSQLVRAGQGRFCSNACRTTASRGITTVERTCLACGVVFALALKHLAHRPGYYCSLACSGAGRTPARPPCEQCGQPVTHRHKYRRFCSNECRYIHLAAQPKNKVACTCLRCGSIFHRWPGELKQPGQGQYCSKRCSGLSRFNVDPSGWSTRWRNGSAARRALMNSRPYREWRKAVLARDSFTCQRCAARDGELHAHHIKGWAAHPELRYDVGNGETLCSVCHGKVHGLNFSK